MDLAETNENENENERGNENGNENENGKGRQSCAFCGKGRRFGSSYLNALWPVH